jgi:hypothetical protein
MVGAGDGVDPPVGPPGIDNEDPPDPHAVNAKANAIIAIDFNALILRGVVIFGRGAVAEREMRRSAQGKPSHRRGASRSRICYSGFCKGKSSTSRIDVSPVNSMMIRSIP